MDLFGPAMLTDPYTAYAELRQRDPVHWSDQLGAWVLTRYDDVNTVLRDPTFSSKLREEADPSSGAAADLVEATAAFVHSSLVFSDPPEHTRLGGQPSVHALGDRAPLGRHRRRSRSPAGPSGAST